jgi:Mce-associated membrane protein
VSDEQRTPDADPAAADATEASEAASTRPRPRPANPQAAAARRARQLGGTRRPQPGPRPAEPSDRSGETEASEEAAKPAAVSTTKPAPKSSVGKAAARPRPRPRPRPTPGPDTTVDDAPAATAPTRSRAPLAVSLGLVVVLLAAGVVFLVLSLTAKPEVSAAETERALAAAKSDVALLTSYGYQTIDADSAKAAAVITGDFKDQYLKAIDTVVKPQLPTTQTVAVGQVDTAGLVSADPKGRQVVVLVYAQQSVTNKAQTTPRIDALQIRVTMDLVDGQWLVSQLEQLGNNA